MAMSPVRRTNKRNPAVASDCEFKKRPDHNSGSRNCSSEPLPGGCIVAGFSGKSSLFSGTLCVFDFLHSPPEADAGRGRTGDALPQPIQQCFDLSVLEFDDLLLTLVHHTTQCGEQNVPWLEQEGHIRRRNQPVSGADA